MEHQKKLRFARESLWSLNVACFKFLDLLALNRLPILNLTHLEFNIHLKWLNFTPKYSTKEFIEFHATSCISIPSRSRPYISYQIKQHSAMVHDVNRKKCAYHYPSPLQLNAPNRWIRHCQSGCSRDSSSQCKPTTRQAVPGCFLGWQCDKELAEICEISAEFYQQCSNLYVLSSTEFCQKGSNPCNVLFGFTLALTMYFKTYSR